MGWLILANHVFCVRWLEWSIALHQSHATGCRLQAGCAEKKWTFLCVTLGHRIWPRWVEPKNLPSTLVNFSIIINILNHLIMRNFGPSRRLLPLSFKFPGRTYFHQCDVKFFFRLRIFVNRSIHSRWKAYRNGLWMPPLLCLFCLLFPQIRSFQRPPFNIIGSITRMFGVRDLFSIASSFFNFFP